MKLGKRILLGVGCAALLLVAWIVVITIPTGEQTQLSLIEEALTFIDDGIYIRAVPILEEAVGYQAAYTARAESMLKELYVQLITQQGYQRKYTSLLETQMARADAEPAVYLEAASFYLGQSKLTAALTALRRGIEKTGDAELLALYEANRYGYRIGRHAYEAVTAISGTTIAVQEEGLWGLADSDGTLRIPCQYEKISTFSSGRAIVRKDGEIYAVDGRNNRLALLKESAADFGNYANDRVALLTGEGWKRATGEFILGSAAFEALGTYSEGYIAAKTGGKWGVVDIDLGWLIPAEYDAVMMDELGLCYGQKAVFAQRGGSVYLFLEGVQVGDAYEDARPFGREGYAAVKKNGKWGFIDTAGQLRIAYQFEDALSFGQHLAAVCIEGQWGYISLNGQVVIDPVFLQAKSFGDGSAPVLTEQGWQFITLLEYIKGASL